MADIPGAGGNVGGIPEAPTNGTSYARKDSNWSPVAIQNPAPEDLNCYVQCDSTWTQYSLQEGFLIDITNPASNSPTIGVGFQLGSNMALNTATNPDTLDAINSYVTGITLSIVDDDLTVTLTRNNGLPDLSDTINIDTI